MTLPILFSFRRCPFAIRARLALAEAGVAVELREVVLRNKPPELLDASPKGTVPVLVLPDAKVIDESLAIMNWAASQGGAWSPSDSNSDLVGRNDGFFKPNLDRYKYASRYEGDPLEHRAQALEFVAELDELLSAQPFLAGDDFGFPDAAIAPFVRQFSGADREWFESLEFEGVRDWLARFVASERFARVMGKFRAWCAGDQSLVWPQ